MPTVLAKQGRRVPGRGKSQGLPLRTLASHEVAMRLAEHGPFSCLLAVQRS
jgi:hypothetical protein